MFVKNSKNFYELSSFKLPGLLHGFSTRDFGNMSDKYASKTEVDSNIMNFARAVGFDSKNIAHLNLNHGTHVALITKSGLVPDSDAAVTNIPGLGLWLVTADCAPLIFFDPKLKAIGIAHSGWRGTVGKIALKVLGSMVWHYNSRPEDILVGIGPTIGPCCYNDNIDPVERDLPEWQNFMTHHDSETWSLDLNAFTIHELEDVGIKRENIDDSKFCTMDHKDEFFSSQLETAGLEQPSRFATFISLI